MRERGSLWRKEHGGFFIKNLITLKNSPCPLQKNPLKTPLKKSFDPTTETGSGTGSIASSVQSVRQAKVDQTLPPAFRSQIDELRDRNQSLLERNSHCSSENGEGSSPDVDAEIEFGHSPTSTVPSRAANSTAPSGASMFGTKFWV